MATNKIKDTIKKENDKSIKKYNIMDTIHNIMDDDKNVIIKPIYDNNGTLIGIVGGDSKDDLDKGYKQATDFYSHYNSVADMSRKVDLSYQFIDADAIPDDTVTLFGDTYLLYLDKKIVRDTNGHIVLDLSKTIDCDISKKVFKQMVELELKDKNDNDDDSDDW